MSTVLTSYAEYGNASLTVTNSAELNAAVKQLAGSAGGTITVDPNGGPYNLTLNGVGSSNAPVLIESGSGGMAHFESLTFVNSSYIAVDGIDVDTSHKTSQLRFDDDLRIERSDHIEIANSNFTGSASGYLDGTGGGTAGNTGAFVLKSQDILIDNNTFTNHFYGIKAVDTVGLIFEDNEITQFQADAFHGGGLQDAQILSNHLHTALGSVQSMVHSDFIQIRGAGTTLQNSNIEIANNLIDSSSGSGAQGIHMGSGGTSIRSTDISIHDNVIHTALPHGIGVGSIDNLEVYNNTVLWNQATSVVASPGATPNSWDARIIISGSTNTSVHDNIASWIRINGTHDPNGGYQIVYDDPNAANYADKHIVNLDGSGNPNSYDLNIDQSSPLYGSFGAAMSSGGTATISASAVGNASDPSGSQNPTAATSPDAVVSTSHTEESETAFAEAFAGNGEIPNILNADLLASSEFGSIESPEEPYKQSDDDAAESSSTAQSSLAEQMVFATHDFGVSFEGSLTDWLSGASQALEEVDVVRTGESGPDQILGGSGSDIINGKGASDLLVGGAGRDRLVGEKGEDTLFGGDGKDLLNAGRGDDFLFGGDGKDKLIGAEGRDWLSGGLGNDLLKGGAGNDILVGGSGSDTIVGGEDNDVLIGGDGADRFMFLDGFGQDTILDFNSSESQEKIDMRGVSEIKDWFDVSTRTQEYNDGLLVSLESGDTLYLADLAIEELYADDFWF